MTNDEQKSSEGQEQEFVIRTVNDFEQQILDNDAVIAEKDAIHGREADSDIPWQAFGRVMQWQNIHGKLLLTLENGEAELVWFADNILRVRVNPVAVEQQHYFSYFLQEKIEVDDHYERRIQADDNVIVVQVGRYAYRIAREALAIACWQGESLCWQVIDFSADSGQRQVGMQMLLREGEACYGTGERAFGLNLRGRALSMWNTDPGGYGRGDDPINTCISFYTGVHDDGAYGLLWDTPARSQFDLGAQDMNVAYITGETPEIGCYLFAGARVDAVLRGYSLITGRMPMPPLWALGYHQSRYSYATADEVLTVAAMLREKCIPCDVIYLDIHYLDKYKVFTWDKDAFPDLADMVAQLHAMNMKVVPILDPGVKVEAGYAGYETGLENGIFMTYPDGELVAGVVWAGLSYFPDFTDSAAREWWAQQVEPLLACGIDGLWNDMNEPLIFQIDAPPRGLPDYAQHKEEGLGGTHSELHNVYGTLMAQASRTGLERQRPDRRQFIFTRAASAGAQRVASSWTGDNHSTWDDLHIAITTTLQMGMSGLAFTGSDVGGFMGDTDGELLTRWTQAGAYMPFFRNHCAVDAVHQEPWSFGEPYEGAIRVAIEERYRLMPYLYTAFAQHATYGMPIIRPLFMAEQNNPTLRDVDDCFLLGDVMLIAPVLEKGALRRTLYLPEGDWYNFHTHVRYHGGTVIRVDAPLDRMPVFVKSGAVLPLWETQQHLANGTPETLILRVYTDSGETVIYEDAGEGLDYREGAYRWVRYQTDEVTDALTLRRTIEGDYVPTYTSVELQLVGSRSLIERIEVDGVSHFDLTYRDGMVILRVDAGFKEVGFYA